MGSRLARCLAGRWRCDGILEAALSYSLGECGLTWECFAARFLLIALGDLGEDRPALFGHCRIGELTAFSCPVVQLLRPA